MCFLFPSLKGKKPTKEISVGEREKEKIFFMRAGKNWNENDHMRERPRERERERERERMKEREKERGRRGERE